jgi:DNA polymerase I-like protein with 3'-5' exonuclease and polymerase domains
MLLEFTTVGNDRLPELPDGWLVAVDTESSGLFLDGDPIPSPGRPAQPESHVSVVSVSFRWPEWSEEKQEWVPGKLVDFAWAFDQGPLIGKPGTPVEAFPDTKVKKFLPVDETLQQKILKTFTAYFELETPLAPEDLFNEKASEYLALIGWLDRRDTLCMHNSKHDMHQFRGGLRAGAGNQAGVQEGLGAWDADSEPGQWRFDQPQVTGMMEPSNKPLRRAKRRRRIYDTMLNQKQLFDQLEVSSLKPTGDRLFGEGESGEQQALTDELKKLGVGLTKRYDLLLWFDFAAMKKYACKDTNLTYRLREYQEDRIYAGAVLDKFAALEEKEHQLRTTLYRAERRGVAYDHEGSWAEGVRVRAWNKIAENEFPFDVTKPVQVKRFYYGPKCPRATEAPNIAKNKAYEALKLAKTAEEGVEQAKLACVPNKRGITPAKYIKAVEVANNKAQKALAEAQRLQAMADRYQLVLDQYGYGVCPSSCPQCGGTNGFGYVPVSYSEKTNEPQLDELAIQALHGEGAPFIDEYRAFKKRAKSANDWYTNWSARTGRDGRIRTSYNQTVQQADRPGQLSGGVRSSRLSCNRWGALQIPKKDLIPEGCALVRGFIGHEPGYKMYEHDLATGEFRVAVVLSGIYRLWDALDNKLDVHEMNAKALGLLESWETEENSSRYKSRRQAGKGATFCILYGGGPKALKDQLEKALGEPISMQRAKSAILNFYKEYPEFKRTTDQALRKVSRDLGGSGYLTMLDGWQRWYSLNEKTNSAFNQAIQANLARACIDWMLAVERELPGVLLLQIHDSLVTRHTDDEQGKMEAQRVSDIGNEVFERYFKLPQRGNRIMEFDIEPEEWSANK